MHAKRRSMWRWIRWPLYVLLLIIVVGGLLPVFHATPALPACEAAGPFIFHGSDSVHANVHWQHTNIRLTRDGCYRIVATGSWRDTRLEPCSGKGMRVWYLLGLQGCVEEPGAPWFSLLGRIGDQGPVFLIGDSCSITASVSGELQCAANDVTGFYWNNDEALSVVVRVR
jgi:hypothetical protein